VRRAALALALTACAAIAAGCGEDSDGPAPADDSSTELTVTVDPDGTGGEQARVAEVACPGDEQAVCDAVAATPDDPGAPIDPQTPCTEVYGGPDSLFVEGTLRGEPIESAFSRENGCEIERFDRLAELLKVLFPDYQPGSAIAP
jgi:hypothetical protein